jgi:putative tricarboxylic transport membrane protein
MNQRFDRIAGLVFLAIGLGFMYESRNISKSAYGSAVGPDMFPFVLGLILALLGVRLCYETVRYTNVSKEKVYYDYKRFLIILISSILYAYFLEEIGYVIGTFLFLLVGFQVMEKGKWLSSFLISSLFSVGVYVIFVEVLKGSLPSWPIWFGL